MKSSSIKLSLIVAALFCSSIVANAQGYRYALRGVTWVFGLGTNLVVDNGSEFSFKFDPKNNWNIPVFPTKITVDAYLKSGWSLQTEFCYNQYKSNKIIDKVSLLKNSLFFSSDANLLYHFNNLFPKKTQWFDPYLHTGFGLTYRQEAINNITGTNNLGLGCNFFVYEGFGFGFQSQYKFGLKGGAKSTYLQHSFSLIYKFETTLAKNSYD